MLLFGLIAYYIVLSHPDPWQEAALAKKQQTAQEACAAFLAAIPAPLALRRLTQKEQEQLLFQYMSLRSIVLPMALQGPSSAS